MLWTRKTAAELQKKAPCSPVSSLWSSMGSHAKSTTVLLFCTAGSAVSGRRPVWDSWKPNTHKHILRVHFQFPPHTHIHIHWLQKWVQPCQQTKRLPSKWQSRHPVPTAVSLQTSCCHRNHHSLLPCSDSVSWCFQCDGTYAKSCPSLASAWSAFPQLEVKTTNAYVCFHFCSSIMYSMPYQPRTHTPTHTLTFAYQRRLYSFSQAWLEPSVLPPQACPCTVSYEAELQKRSCHCSGHSEAWHHLPAAMQDTDTTAGILHVCMAWCSAN